MKLIFTYLFICFVFNCCVLTKNTSYKKFLDPRDGERYGYVEIQGDTWMTENMRYNVKGSKLNPDNPSPLYGRLYNWEQAMKACPEGWRLSTDLDWMMLEKHFIPEDSLFMVRVSRGQNIQILKAKKGWQSKGTDSLRLNILPAGWSDYNGFHVLSKAALFWTSDSHYEGGVMAEMLAYYRVIEENNLGIYYGVQDKKVYLSCRCVKNKKGWITE